MNQDYPRPRVRRDIPYPVVAGILVLAAVAAYFAFQGVAALRQEVSACGEGGCKALAERARSVPTTVVATPAAIPGDRTAEPEPELARLRGDLARAEENRHRLAEQVAACGADGCQTIVAKLAKAERELRALRRQQSGLRQQMAALRDDNRLLRDQLAKDFSAQTGQRLLLMEILRIGPFEVGSFELSDEQYVELRERLAPYRNTPLLVVGVADQRPYREPSAQLKQLGLMLARAQLVRSMGYEVYYQVRQNDPGVPESRGVIVYQIAMQPHQLAGQSRESISMAVPTFYTAQ